jgi:hypothetical protein
VQAFEAVDALEMGAGVDLEAAFAALGVDAEGPGVGVLAEDRAVEVPEGRLGGAARRTRAGAARSK